MPRRKNAHAGHTGRTPAGHTCDVKVERVGKVTIYKRGDTYYLYYRQAGVSHRRRIDGNLAVARATAHKVQNALDEGRASPIAYARTSPEKLVEGYLDAVANVQKLALGTRDRYRAALARFTDFCRDAKIGTIDTVGEATVEDFVRWLRGQKRTRNGAAKGRRDFYKVGGVKFILATCRTAFNWAARHRMLPPFAQNPFILFPIDKLKDPAESADGPQLFTTEQETAFFNACNDWQKPIFVTLASYGLRLGELTHLLIDDVDFVNDLFVIRSKPWLFWNVKTGRERKLPLLPGLKKVFQAALGERKAGFVFLNAEFIQGPSRPACSFTSAQAFKTHAEELLAEFLLANPDADERAQKRTVVAFSRSMGQIPEKRVRCEFMGLTEKIGCPEFTRVHDLRHLFTTRAQAAGTNPILVQELLGHTTLEMTRRYTHLGMDSKREALEKLEFGHRS